MRSFAKLVGNWTAVVLVAPIWLAYDLLARIGGEQRTFPGASQFFSLIPGVTGQYLRRAFYELTLPECGRDASIGFQTVMSHPTVRMGDHVYVGVGCMLGDITIENDVLVGSHVSIINGARQHGAARLDIPVRLQPGEYPRLTIGADSWIGDRAIVMAHVGRHCIVGAGAVVTKPVPDYAIVAGNPARIVNWRREQESGSSPQSSADDALASSVRPHVE
jgi:virginiamycin A acetyltransferase